MLQTAPHEQRPFRLMCGIAGIIGAPDAPPPDQALLDALTRSIAHRGPDGHGHIVVGRVVLVHNRLSIIDLVTGDQPLYSGSATGITQVPIPKNVQFFSTQIPNAQLQTAALHYLRNPGSADTGTKIDSGLLDDFNRSSVAYLVESNSGFGATT